MATDSQTLFDESKCFACAGASAAELLALALLDNISKNIGPPVEKFRRISNVGDVRKSNVADQRIYQ